MKALVKSKPSPGIWMEDKPIPKVGTNDVLIKIHKAGVCGTDLHIYNWDDWAQRNIQTPKILGHEFVGEIVEIGPGVSGYDIGDRVTGEGHLTCGICRNCRAGKRHLCIHSTGIGGGRDGAFAEYMVMPASNLWKLHADISSDIATILDPLGNAVHTALSFNVTGEDVLITGAGPIGIMAAVVCKFVGARHVVITDVNEYRLDLIRQLNAGLAVNVANENLDDIIKNLNMSTGFDVGLEMSGNPLAFQAMLKHMYNGGHIALLGFLPPNTQIDWDQIILRGLYLKGVYGREVFETWYKMTQLIKSGMDISAIITHRFSFEEYKKAFEVVRSGLCGKVILEWD